MGNNYRTNDMTRTLYTRTIWDGLFVGARARSIRFVFAAACASDDRGGLRTVRTARFR